MDKYEDVCLNSIRMARETSRTEGEFDERVRLIINDIYEDGFSDGYLDAMANGEDKCCQNYESICDV